MTEHIDYDDDPADTAARAWLLRTKLGRSTLRLASTDPRAALLRACRAMYLLGAKAEGAVDRNTRDIERLEKWKDDMRKK